MALIVAVDPSLTSTGIIVLHDGKLELAQTTKNQPELGTIERVKLILQQVDKIISHPNITPDLIVIEGFSYGSKGKRLFDIAYLGHRIREDLDSFKEQENIPWIEVPPSQLKQFATGKGNANKEIILQQVYKHWGVELHDNNQADAYVLAKIGEAYLGETDDLTAFQREVIANLKGEKVTKKKKVK